MIVQATSKRPLNAWTRYISEDPKPRNFAPCIPLKRGIQSQETIILTNKLETDPFRGDFFVYFGNNPKRGDWPAQNFYPLSVDFWTIMAT